MVKSRKKKLYKGEISIFPFNPSLEQSFCVQCYSAAKICICFSVTYLIDSLTFSFFSFASLFANLSNYPSISYNSPFYHASYNTIKYENKSFSFIIVVFYLIIDRIDYKFIKRFVFSEKLQFIKEHIVYKGRKLLVKTLVWKGCIKIELDRVRYTWSYNSLEIIRNSNKCTT